ncbi:pre-B-cell leukemia transcription factor-interacting protein 1 isoform X2 [Monodelphis domestica]|uniref:PBX homeobox interacting protein 1 n=1 Tax=Monodelphis domestica TaxID=13616 RepID=A0A5F8GHV4_MONDO|nr:pre-B-cell leukemia transcription factor-interacting protein 1 isoform X2 [Monodelphis domestica]XP_056672303.1 pre-B-cell leukemia transcription factor-interacting protein 1 isoform X2 [Monodelphis domestica]XP_056672304.1 pre-B-cell leukemia transcription factor-interacting protein 1 isoform X2 [Monodelphis domestica]
MESSSPESDNSWVIAGSEGCLPVETLGPESERAPQTSVDELPGTLDGEAPTACKTPPVQPDACPPEEADVKVSLESNEKSLDLPSPEEEQTKAEQLEATEGTGLESDIMEQRDLISPHNGPWSPKTEQVGEEFSCSSSDDDNDMDVEGLRRRRGARESRPPYLPASVGGHDQASSEGRSGELGLTLNTCLLGALVLVGLGFLLFSGPAENLESQVTPEPQDAEHIQDGLGQQQQAHYPAGSLPSLQSMSLLLDKLAKENQDIRLLQAQLQAQKEELQNLLHKHPGLEEENERLRGSLQQREASQRVLESEMQELRSRLGELEETYSRGVDGACESQSAGKPLQEPAPGLLEPKGFLEQKEQLEAEAQMLRRELEKQRLLLSSVQRDLKRSLHESGLGDRDRADLAKLGQRLAMELQEAESWGPGEGQVSQGSANTSQSLGQGGAHFVSSKEPSQKEKHKDKDRQGEGKAEKWKHKKEEFTVEKKKNFRGKGDGESGGKWKQEKLGTADLGGKKSREWRGSKEHPKKSWGGPWGSQGPHPVWEGQKPMRDGAKGDGSAHSDPQLAWKKVLGHKYRVPQGCSSVAQCAHQEGLAMFGLDFPPVRKQELAALLQKYLARLPWGQRLPEPMTFLSTYFGEDGLFRHDRLRFRDFVEAMEDSLEEAAVRETGDDDEVDDFEDFIFGHFFGDKALRKRSGKKDKYQKGPRSSGPKEGPRNYQEG